MMQTPFIILLRGRVAGLKRTLAAGERQRDRLGRRARLYKMTTGELDTWVACSQRSDRSNLETELMRLETEAVRWGLIKSASYTGEMQAVRRATTGDS